MVEYKLPLPCGRLSKLSPQMPSDALHISNLTSESTTPISLLLSRLLHQSMQVLLYKQIQNPSILTQEKSTACSSSHLKQEFLAKSYFESLSSTDSKAQNPSSSEDPYDLYSSARWGSRIICGRIPLDIALCNCKGSWKMKHKYVPRRKKENSKVISATISNVSRW